MPERKLGEKNSKIGSSLYTFGTVIYTVKVSDLEEVNDQYTDGDML